MKLWIVVMFALIGAAIAHQFLELGRIQHSRLLLLEKRVGELEDSLYIPTNSHVILKLGSYTNIVVSNNVFLHGEDQAQRILLGK